MIPESLEVDFQAQGPVKRRGFVRRRGFAGVLQLAFLTGRIGRSTIARPNEGARVFVNPRGYRDASLLCRLFATLKPEAV